MCRWLAYTGNALQLETVLFNAKHSLIDQSLHSRLGQTTTNGDGFGIGWYGQPTDIPFRYRCIHPAWSDRNLREAARAIRAPAVRRAHSCGHRYALAGNQLSSVPVRAVALHA